MTLANIWDVITKIIDIGIVWLVFYFILKNIKNNIKMVLIFKGVLLILVIKLLSDLLDLYTVGVILQYCLEWGPLAIIVIFQPEIRRHKVLTVDEREKVVYEIMRAIEYFKKNRIGALMVIEREISLQEYIEPATKVYADLSSDLLETIFFPNGPLHDGGVIVQGDRITVAGAVFKTSMNPSISKRLGTRHRAALGIAEESDAIALVVSEESGRISIAVDGELNYNLTIDEFRMILIEALNPKPEVFYEAEEKKSAGDE